MTSQNSSSSSTKTAIFQTLVNEATKSAEYDLPKYNTGELPRIGHLKMIMDPMREYFPVKVTMKSKIEAFEVIRQNLDPETEMPIFKEFAFGHFISMSENMIYFGVLTHYLLLRQIKIKKSHELWFMVNGTTTRFGMREFALITGLNCGETPELDVVLKASKNIRLLEHFKSHVVLVADLKKLLTGKKIKGSDKAKIAIIYFLAQVLLSGDEKKTAPLDWLSYVDDLEFFNSYPWGRVSFECTLRALRKNLKEKFQKWVRKGRNKSIKKTYSICGFPWAFQVWAFETFPTIGATFAKMVDGRLPRILKWEARRGMAVPILYPTEEEMNSMCMRLYLSYADQEDPEIDQLASFLDSSARMPKPVPEGELELQVQPEPEAELEPQVQLEPEAELELQVQPEPEEQHEPQVQPEPEDQLEQQVHSEPESESKNEK
ncbi:uncharacterized protein LOC112093193 [Morus notabilis]|uniref:uncharacterized protein LOC112093193 n=1 Tax=Morus notabilis TaxID=981085 RepID=UPI000CED6968|nr:uncharacterized protein LOC112093193 [Morus notabilis]